jgi:hypothetical protein
MGLRHAASKRIQPNLKPESVNVFIFGINSPYAAEVSERHQWITLDFRRRRMSCVQLEVMIKIRWNRKRKS